LAFFHLKLELGSGQVFGQGLKDFRGVVGSRQDLEQPGPGVQAVVEAEPALLEEGMTAHFTGQRCVGFSQLGLDHGMARLPHQRGAAGLGNGACNMTAAFYVEDNGGTGFARQYIAGVKYELTVGPDDFARLCHDSQAIGVAVKCKAYLAVCVLYMSDEVLQVGGVGGVGVVIGKPPIDLAVQFVDLATQGTEQLGRNSASDAVSTIDGNFHGARQLDIACYALDVVIDKIDR